MPKRATRASGAHLQGSDFEDHGPDVEFDPNAKPIWEEFDEVLAAAPKDYLDRLPRDGAQNHDRYIYGVGEDAP